MAIIKLLELEECKVPPPAPPAPEQPAPEPEQPPAPPEQEPAPVKAPAGCEFLQGTGLEAGIPFPGSKEFSRHGPDVVAVLEKIVDETTGWVDFVGQKNPVISFFKLDLTDAPRVQPFRWIFEQWNKLIDKLGQGIDFVVDIPRKAIQWVYNIQRCLALKCGVKAMTGLWIIRQLMDNVRDADLSVSLVAGFKLTIGFNFPVVERWLDAVEHWLCPMEPISPQEAVEAYLKGNIDDLQAETICKVHGLDKEMFQILYKTSRERLDWQDALQYVYRQKGDDDDRRRVLVSRGFTDETDISMAQEMFWELPGIADHLHWLTRNVFDTDYVRDYQLMEGFEEKFWPQFGDDLTALGMRKKYAQLHYAAHWIQPSPEQLYQFLYRTDDIKQATGKEFNINDVERLLTEQDYSPLARQWFVATAYQVPAISYVKEWYRGGVIDRETLEGYHRRLGYTHFDASRFADVDDLQKRRMRASSSRGWTTQAASQAFAAGEINEDRHNLIYKGLGYTRDEAKDAREVATRMINVRAVTRSRSRVMTGVVRAVQDSIKLGIMSPTDGNYALVRAGWPWDMAQSVTAAYSSEAAIGALKETLRYLKSRVADGSIVPQAAYAELLSLGFTPQAAQRYIALWQLMMTPARKHRTADKIVADVANGHLTRAQATVRLTNLGYDNADVILYMADAQSKLASLRAKGLAAQQKAGRARDKANAAVVKEAKRLHEETLRNLKREAPIAKLQKWARLGLIGRDLFVKRMVLYGFGEPDAELWYKEACAGKGAACVETTPEQTTNGTPPGSTGQPPG